MKLIAERGMRPFMAGLCCVAAQAASAAPVGLVVIQPIQLCNSTGTECANEERETLEAVGDEIWAQAGLDLLFLPWSAAYDTGMYEHSQSRKGQMYAVPENWGGSADPLVINMWFVKDLLAPGTTECTGCRNMLIHWPTVKRGPLDTPAHEIGHALGLDHFIPNQVGLPLPGTIRNLMAADGFRHRFEGLENIYPDGMGNDRLESFQLGIATASPLIHGVAEPWSLGLLLAGLGGWLTTLWPRGLRRGAPLGGPASASAAAAAA